MEPDDGFEGDEPLFAWLPPEDRLWRHPSEQHLIASSTGGSPTAPTWSVRGRTALSLRSSAARTATVAFVAGVLGALVASGVGMATGVFGGRTTIMQSVSRYSSADTLALASTNPQGGWPSLTDAMAPSIVSVTVDSPAGVLSGSGLIYATGDGRSYVLSDASLFDRGGVAHVRFADGTEGAGHVVAADPTSGVAVLWVPSVGEPSASLGSVADVRVAQPVLTVSSAAASGQASSATIASLDKEVTTSAGHTLDELIALSSPALPAGQAGGAVIDASGSVIGISVHLTPTDPDEAGLSFAVPIDLAVRVASQALDGQHISHPWVGMADGSDLPSATAQRLGVPGGVKLGEVTPGGPAARIGLTADDVVVGFDGHQVTTTGALVRAIVDATPSKPASISYLAGGRMHSAKLVVANQPSS